MNTSWSPSSPKVAETLERVYALEEPDHAAALQSVSDVIERSMPGQRAMFSSIYRMRPGGRAEFLARLPQFAVDVPGVVEASEAPGAMATLPRVTPVGFLNEVGVPFEKWGALPLLAEAAPAFEDILVLHALSPDGVGISLGALVGAQGAWTPPLRRQWARISLHLAAAALARPRCACPRSRHHAGRQVLHADGAAKDRVTREGLRRSVRAIDRVRGRRVDAETSLETWQILTERRWTIADTFEKDGRRFIVAYANEPQPLIASGLTSLSVREKQLAVLAAFGHSNKEIAYELGI